MTTEIDRFENICLQATTAGPAPTFELIQHTVYPFAYIYDGEVEATTATFTTDPLSPASWLGDLFASKLEEEVRKAGGRPIEVKVYVDVSPLLYKDFKIEVVSTPVTQVAGGVALLPIWATILIAAIGITAVLVTATLLINTIKSLFQHNPALEDVKPGWGRETLILTIQDSEEYWKRTPTPPATLDAMSEEELREYLDAMAEQEVPTEVSWWPIAAAAGVGVLGVGLLSARKEKE